MSARIGVVLSAGGEAGLAFHAGKSNERDDGQNEASEDRRGGDGAGDGRREALARGGIDDSVYQKADQWQRENQAKHRLLLEQLDVFGAHRLEVSEQRDHEPQTDGGFSRRDDALPCWFTHSQQLASFSCFVMLT